MPHNTALTCMYNFSLMFQGTPKASRFDVRQILYVVSANNTGGGEQVLWYGKILHSNHSLSLILLHMLRVEPNTNRNHVEFSLQKHTFLSHWETNMRRYSSSPQIYLWTPNQELLSPSKNVTRNFQKRQKWSTSKPDKKMGKPTPPHQKTKEQSTTFQCMSHVLQLLYRNWCHPQNTQFQSFHWEQRIMESARKTYTRIKGGQ